MGADEFIGDVTGLQEHYDDRVQHARLQGGVVRFSGMRIVKVRRAEELLSHHGKLAKYMVGVSGVTFDCRDDVDDPVGVVPISVSDYIKTLKDCPCALSPPGGATRRWTFAFSGSLTSSTLRSLLAHPATLDVWLRESDGNLRVTATTVSPSQIVGGLSSSIRNALSGRPRVRWRRPRFCGKSKGSGRRR